MYLMGRQELLVGGGQVARASSLARLCLLAALSALAAVALGAFAGATRLEQEQLAVRYTARAAWLWFLLVYLARPVHQLAHAKFTLAWQSLRRSFGLAFASAMGIHLVCVVVYLAAGGNWPRPVSRAYLIFSSVLLAVMVVTSNLRVQKRLGPSWRRIHRAGIHVLWFAFAGAFFFQAQKHELVAWPLLLLALAAGGLRMASAFR
jgi:methionine sulfoxide reductase heme-binding subunit